VDLTSSATAALTFDSRYDGGRVEILIDGQLQTLAGVPESDDWVAMVFDLPGYAGHVVQVRFVRDPAGIDEPTGRGWEIRNVVIAVQVFAERR
jgi:hypothetical protein